MQPIRLLRHIATHPLNRHAPVRALGRFVRWQLLSRLKPGPHTVPFIDDTRLVMETGMVGATSNYYTGLHELDEMGFATRTVWTPLPP